MAIESLNPASGELIKTYTEWSDDEVKQTIDAVHRTYQDWCTTSLEYLI